MTAHAETHAPEAVHEIQYDTQESRIRAAIALKFEPSEVRDFELADKAAGQMMGKLLASLFFVLLFLMTGVNLWMIGRDAKGTDPQGPVGVSADQHGAADHPAEAGHH